MGAAHRDLVSATSLSSSQPGAGGGIFQGMRTNFLTICPGVPRLLLLAVLIGILTVPVSGCGRKAQPVPPPGSDFPRTYPSQ